MDNFSKNTSSAPTRADVSAAPADVAAVADTVPVPVPDFVPSPVQDFVPAPVPDSVPAVPPTTETAPQLPTSHFYQHFVVLDQLKQGHDVSLKVLEDNVKSNSTKFCEVAADLSSLHLLVGSEMARVAENNATGLGRLEGEMSTAENKNKFGV